jgi:hypothetical protein
MTLSTQTNDEFIFIDKIKNRIYNRLYNNVLTIIINGKGRSGKDTFINFMKLAINDCKSYYQTFFKDKLIDVESISTIDPIKKMCEIIGYDDKHKTLESRELLSDVKKIVKKYNNYPVKYVLDCVDEIHKKNLSRKYFVFIHCRELSEIEELNEILNGITLLIKNIRNDCIDYKNTSDNSVEDYNYDYIVENDNTLQSLDIKAQKLYKEFSELLK